MPTLKELIDAPRVDNRLAEKTAGLVTKLVEALVSNGSLDSARHMVETMRIACDEATALINAARRV